ncbi:MAG: pyridoxal 5'-phosphate synthase glutaminase subunit PdxT [Dehalococcoidia bacterium]|nr:pyridoxal 5'-phosphate synthase glutaminase subunit PdxT [Dehalococcoidia bacterium]
MGETRIGVLALQGAFIEHVRALSCLGAQAVEVRLPRDLEGLRGLVIPGGESTTIARLMNDYALTPPIKAMIEEGIPVWGTCAGMIMLAQNNGSIPYPTLAAMDAVVERNAFGRQVDSFEAELRIAALGDPPFRGVFIRAPVFRKIGAGVKALAEIDGGSIVAAQEANLLATAFHPELTDDMRFHQYFLRMVDSASKPGKRG